MAGIYARFGIDMPPESLDAIRAIDDESKGAAGAQTQYSLADYGLTEDQVKSRFAGL